jgi:hypothetical protein
MSQSLPNPARGESGRFLQQQRPRRIHLAIRRHAHAKLLQATASADTLIRRCGMRTPLTFS